MCVCNRINRNVFVKQKLFFSHNRKTFQNIYRKIQQKRKRSINPLFLDKYEIADISGKGICVVYSKELVEESLKPNKLQRHLETYAKSLSCMKRPAREFSIIVIDV